MLTCRIFTSLLGLVKTWTDNDFFLTSKQSLSLSNTAATMKRKRQKIVWLKPWNPLTKTLEPQTCQSLSNPSSLYSTALGCYQLTLEAETKTVQYTLRYYCSSTLLRKDLYTILHGRNDDLVVGLQSREMCVSHEIWLRIESFFLCHKQSLIFLCPGSSESIQLFHNIYMYCLAKIPLAQLGPVDKGCLIPPFHIWSLWIAHIDAC